MAAITREFVRRLRAKHYKEHQDVKPPLIDYLIKTKVLEDVGRSLVECLPIDDKVKVDVSPLFTPIQRSMVEMIHAMDVADAIKTNAMPCAPAYKPLNIEHVIDMFVATSDLYRRLANVYINSNNRDTWIETADHMGRTACLIKGNKMPLNPPIVIDGNKALWSVSINYIKVRLGNTNHGIFMLRYKQAYDFLNEMG